MGMPGIAPVLTGSRIDSLQGGESMSWLTPDLIDTLLGILKAVVILLVVVTCGVHELRRASSAGFVPEPLRTQPRRLGWFAAAGRRHDQDVL